MKTDVIVLGGGAAGLLGAVALARGGMRVTVLEKNPRVGKKLLATGNGRCNLTNLRARDTDYFGSRALAAPALQAFPPMAVADFFRCLGVNLRFDDEGRAYPMSNQASSVLDALRLSLCEAGGEICTDFRAAEICEGFAVSAKDRKVFTGKYLLFAPGGEAAPQLGGGADGYALLSSFGHRATPRRPALTTLVTQAFPALKGIRVSATLCLISDKGNFAPETGEALFTEYGVSGIAAMQLSRFARPGMELSIKLLDADGPSFVRARAKDLPHRAMEDFLNGAVPKRVGQVLCKLSGIALARRADSLTQHEMASLGTLLNAWRIPITGVMDFKNAQVTAGGLDSRDFFPETLMSRRVENLFCAGEVLDVDGPCGGYNLQWAWASALLAAKSILERHNR